MLTELAEKELWDLQTLADAGVITDKAVES